MFISLGNLQKEGHGIFCELLNFFVNCVTNKQKEYFTNAVTLPLLCSSAVTLFLCRCRFSLEIFNLCLRSETAH
jgi:hypothetical protein